MNATFFATPADFRAWLAKHHDTASELLVGFYNVNTKRVAELTKQGRMHASGLAAFKARDPKRSGIYSFEQREKNQKLDAAYVAKLKASRKAWAFFQAQPPGYQRLASLFVMSAKKDDTRLRRLARLIADSEAGRRIGLLGKPRAISRRRN